MVIIFFSVPTIKIAPQLYLNEQTTVNEGADVFYIPCFPEGIPLPSINWESIDVSIRIYFIHFERLISKKNYINLEMWYLHCAKVALQHFSLVYLKKKKTGSLFTAFNKTWTFLSK